MTQVVPGEMAWNDQLSGSGGQRLRSTVPKYIAKITFGQISKLSNKL